MRLFIGIMMKLLRTVRIVKIIILNWVLIRKVKFLFEVLDLFEVLFGVGLEHGDISFLEF